MTVLYSYTQMTLTDIFAIILLTVFSPSLSNIYGLREIQMNLSDLFLCS